jgi:hypothetical protein
MRTLLVFALTSYPYCPPEWVAGAKRAATLARYLPEYGWRPIVITYPWGQPVADWRELYAQSKEKHSVVIPVDHDLHWAVRGQRWWRALAVKQPALKQVTKLATLLLWVPNWGAFDGDRAGWHRVALEVGREIARLERIDAIWATWMMGWGPLWAADRLAQELQVPWVADIRDDWTVLRSQPPFLAKMTTGSMVRRASRANLVTAVTQPWVDLVRDQVNPNAHLIHNGYLPITGQDIEAPPNKQFTLVYTGSIPEIRAQSLLMLCQALKTLVNESANFAQRAKFVYYGPSSDRVRSVIQAYDLEEQAVVADLIPYAEACLTQKRATALVGLIPCNSVDPGIMTAKIFDYLAARRPILSIPGNPNTVNPLLTETRAGLWADGVEEILAVLRRWFQEWERQGYLAYRGNAVALERYSSRQQMAHLAALLDGLVVPTSVQ